MLLIFLFIAVGAAVYWLFGSPQSQLFGTFPWRVHTKDRVVALTFDDGPNQPYTMQIVDYLNKKGVKATFFQVGVRAQKYPDVTKQIAESGHVIGNHSLEHAFHNYFTRHSFRQELVESQAIFKKILGKEPALFRPPWLWRYPKLFKSLKQYRLQPVSGEFCHPLEIFQPSSHRIAKRVLAKVKPGSIFIFHDGYNAKGADRSQTVKAIKIVVDELLDQGYKFVTISELLNIAAYR